MRAALPVVLDNLVACSLRVWHVLSTLGACSDLARTSHCYICQLDALGNLVTGACAAVA